MQPSTIPKNPPVPKPPTPLAQRFVRYVAGFGVGVAVGVAPYLGKIGVPGFDALLTLLPESMHSLALPLSAAIMGTLAVWTQYSGEEKVKRDWLGKMFRVALAFFFVGLLAFMVVRIFTVVTLKVPVATTSAGGTEEPSFEQTDVSFLVGFSRPNRQPCPVDVSDADCIKRLTFDEGRIAGFWGNNSIRIATLTLLLPYLITTGAFGVMIGLLLLRGSAVEERKRRT